MSKSVQTQQPNSDFCHQITLRYRTGIEGLLNAKAFALDTGVDVWQFAIELRTLLDNGVSRSALRWMVSSGLLDHARETTRSTARSRSFQANSCLKFREDSCFIVTELGKSQLGCHYPSAEGAGEQRNVIKPVWDPQMRELWYGDTLVKRFRRPASNQEAVLSTFQEESWSSRVDDPLPQQTGHDPKRRLHDTINALNRNQKKNVIRFFGDGTGEGICWEART